MLEGEAAEETAEIETVTEETPIEAEVDTEATEKVEPGEAEEEGEFIVTIGEESPPQEDDDEDPTLPKRLRRVIQDKETVNKEVVSENKELKERLASYEKKPEITLGTKPVMSDFEENYETEESAEDQYAKALDGWYVKKEQVGKQDEEVKAKEKQHQAAWQSTLGAYEEKKAVIKAKAPDYDEAEALVKDSLPIVYQGAILDGAKNPALLILALGKNPAKLKELSSITNPSKFIFAVAEMETQLKTSTRKATTSPEKKVVGSGSGANATDSTLAKLEAAAKKSGDYTEVLKHERDQKRKQT
ncbi:hypothetical protein KAR91_01865 [Candidatus Pacearchaeota archaeon]|nr:hypothetical protein [Candidatus Pacearchaeota archaeon]